MASTISSSLRSNSDDHPVPVRRLRAWHRWRHRIRGVDDVLGLVGAFGLNRRSTHGGGEGLRCAGKLGEVRRKSGISVFRYKFGCKAGGSVTSTSNMGPAAGRHWTGLLIVPTSSSGKSRATRKKEWRVVLTIRCLNYENKATSRDRGAYRPRDYSSRGARSNPTMGWSPPGVQHLLQDGGLVIHLLPLRRTSRPWRQR